MCAKYVCFSVQGHDVLKILLKFQKSEKKKVAPSSEVPTGRTLGFLDQEAVPFHQTRVDSSLPSPASGPTPKKRQGTCALWGDRASVDPLPRAPPI